MTDPLRDAVANLLKAKGRFHTEQAYDRLQKAFHETAAVATQEPAAYFWRDKTEGTVGLRFTMPEWVDDPDKQRYELVRLYAHPTAARA